MKTIVCIKRGAALLLCCCLLYISMPASAQQRSDQLMQELGFRRSGNEYLYPLSFFRYACNAKLNRAYLLVPDKNMDSLQDAGDSAMLAWLSGPDVVWEIALPLPGEPGNRALIFMKGKNVTDDKDWQRLAGCSRIQTDGKVLLKESAQKTQLLQEAFTAWQELLSWYRAGKQ